MTSLGEGKIIKLTMRQGTEEGSPLLCAWVSDFVFQISFFVLKLPCCRRQWFENVFSFKEDRHGNRLRT